MMSAAEVTKVSVPETMAAEMAATATVMAPAMTAAMPASVTTTAMAATAASRQRRPSQQRCNRNHGNSSDRFQHRNPPAIRNQ
jgi:flagellar capping protein FliD